MGRLLLIWLKGGEWDQKSYCYYLRALSLAGLGQSEKRGETKKNEDRNARRVACVTRHLLRPLMGTDRLSVPSSFMRRPSATAIECDH